MILNYIVEEDNIYIKQILKDKFYLSERLILKLKKSNKIYKNNLPIQINNIANIGDIICVVIDFEEDNSNIVPTKMDLNIIYEDDCLLILNKPSGIATHPSCRHFDNSLSNGIKFYFDSISLKRKIRPINRLDIDTSGLIMFAKNEYVQECLIRQMKENIFSKQYLALINGSLECKKGIINAPIARKENSIIERCVSLNGDSAITHYTVINEFDNYSLVSFKLETGRTHQIRVHCAYIGHPILGDTLYGKSSNLINRQALHSYKVSFVHPIKKVKMEFTADLPSDFNKLISNKK